MPHSISLFIFSPTRFFLVVSWSIGFCYIFLSSIGSGADEIAHLNRVYQLSENKWIGERKGEQLGGYLPQTIAIAGWNATATVAYDEEKVFVPFANTAIYPPTGYWVYSLSLKTLRYFEVNLPIQSIVYFLRFWGLLTFTILGYWIIRLMPFYQWTFCFLLLLPSSLFLHSKVTPDILTHHLALLFFALIMRGVHTGFNTPKTPLFFILLSVIYFLISFNKIFYLPFFLFFFFLWHKVKKTYYIGVSIVLLFTVLLIHQWQDAIQQVYVPFSSQRPFIAHTPKVWEVRPTTSLEYPNLIMPLKEVNPQQQKTVVLQDPIGTISLVAQSYVLQIVPSFMQYIFCVDTSFGHIVTIIILLLILFFYLYHDFTPFKPLYNFYIICISMMACFLLAIALYLIWCPVGTKVIDGLFGRQHVAIYPLLLMSITHLFFQKIKHNDTPIILFQKIQPFIAFLIIIIHLYGLTLLH